MSVFEPSLAAGFLIRTEARPSTVPGVAEGVFALEPAPRGALIAMDFPEPGAACTAAEVLALPVALRRYSWRHVAHLCFRASARRSAPDLMNHSFAPNVLWHLGCYFALAPIAVADELLVDYRDLLDPAWSGRLVDGASGRPVDGTDWRQSLIASCRRLATLLEETTP